MNAAAILGIGIQVSIFVTVVSLGMRASLSDIEALFRRPGQLIKALLAIFVIMPVFAILAIKIFALHSVIAIVLMALSVSPIPPIFPNTAFKSGGEASFTFGLFTAVTLLSIVLIPTAFVVLDALFARDAKFSEFFLMKTLLISALIPLVIGIALHRLAPAFCERFAGLVGKIGGILLLVSVLPILLALLPTIWSLVGGFQILALTLFALVGAAAGYFLGGPDPKERTVLALATAARHPGIAIALASTNVDETLRKTVAAAVILYLVISTIVVAPFLKWLSDDKTGAKAEKEA